MQIKRWRGCIWLILLLILACGTKNIRETRDQTNKSPESRSIYIEPKQIPYNSEAYLYKESHALVIGNSNYKHWKHLPEATQDTEEIASFLEKNGFNVEHKDNIADKYEFLKLFDDFFNTYGKEGNRVFFYFSGHGATLPWGSGKKMGYLVMIDATKPNIDEDTFKISSVDMSIIVRKAEETKAFHVLFMFDSCFSGSIFDVKGETSNTPPSITDSLKYPVRQFITSGRADEVVPARSVFKTAFLDLLKGHDEEPIPDGYITGSELGLYLESKVPEYNPYQHPQCAKINDPNLNKGNFVFVKNNIENGFLTVNVISNSGNIDWGRIKIDGQFIDSSPIVNYPLLAGKHSLEVERFGYLTHKETILIEKNSSARHTIVLTPN